MALAVLTLAIWSLFNHPRWKWQAWVLVLASLAWSVWRAGLVS